MISFKKHVLVCTNEKPAHCGELGGLGLLQAFRDEVQKRGLQNDVFVSKTGCTKQHHCGPTVIVYPEGVWYKEVTTTDVSEIIESQVISGKIVQRLFNSEIGLRKE